MTGLRLRAVDPMDLSVVSAHVQDAIAQVGDIAYVPAKRRFALMLNRFMWEDVTGPEKIARADKNAPYRRVRAAMHFDAVERVQHQGLRLGRKDAVAELLTLAFEPLSEPAGVIKMTFAGGGVIKLNVECLDVWLTDVSAPWPTPHLPGHGTDTEEPLG
ncbi:MAG: DUF2948 family protein [Alphaproteobacteria bacterium]|nr:DUF2948 family protein [Alphaproteobacteria bacterium]